MRPLVPGWSRLMAWTANRPPRWRPPSLMHSKNFTGCNAASTDVSDAAMDTLRSRTMNAESGGLAIVDRAAYPSELLPVNALSRPGRFARLCSSSVPYRPAGHLTTDLS
jgi:hypothetical protein